MHVLQRESEKAQWPASRQWLSARMETECLSGRKGTDLTQVGLDDSGARNENTGENSKHAKSRDPQYYLILNIA